MRVDVLLYDSQVHIVPLVILTLGMLLYSCTRVAFNDSPVMPPPTHPLSRSVIGYGVISASYTQVVDKPDAEGLSLGYLRKGSIVRIIERRFVNDRENIESWVLVEGNYLGWLREGMVDIYDNAAKAGTAAEFMIQ